MNVHLSNKECCSIIIPKIWCVVNDQSGPIGIVGELKRIVPVSLHQIQHILVIYISKYYKNGYIVQIIGLNNIV